MPDPDRHAAFPRPDAWDWAVCGLPGDLQAHPECRRWVRGDLIRPIVCTPANLITTEGEGWRWEKGRVLAPPGPPSQWSALHRREGALLVALRRGLDPWLWNEADLMEMLIQNGFHVAFRACLAHASCPPKEVLEEKKYAMVHFPLGVQRNSRKTHLTNWLAAFSAMGRAEAVEVLLEAGWRTDPHNKALSHATTPEVAALLLDSGAVRATVVEAMREWESDRWRPDDPPDARATHRAHLHAVVRGWWNHHGPRAVPWASQQLWAQLVEQGPLTRFEETFQQAGLSGLTAVQIPCNSLRPLPDRPSRLPNFLQWDPPAETRTWRNLAPWLFARRNRRAIPLGFQVPSWAALIAEGAQARWSEKAVDALDEWIDLESRVDPRIHGISGQPLGEGWVRCHNAIEQAWWGCPPLSKSSEQDARLARRLTGLVPTGYRASHWPLSVLDQIGHGQEWEATSVEVRSAWALTLIDTMLEIASHAASGSQVESSIVLGYINAFSRLLDCHANPSLRWVWPKDGKNRVEGWRPWTENIARRGEKTALWEIQCRRLALQAAISPDHAEKPRRLRL